jgi:hypothetical protein
MKALAAEVVALRAELKAHELRDAESEIHALEDALGRERAAREVAEREAAKQYGHMLNWKASAEAAERERDEALARPKTHPFSTGMAAIERAEAAEAREQQLREALERIARAGEGIPDWRSMADCASAALGSAAAADTTENPA